MPYGYVLLAATVVLAVRHARSASASSRSKAIVGGLAAASILVPYMWLRFLPFIGFVHLFCVVVQFAVCFYVVFHEAAWNVDDEGGGKKPGAPSDNARAEDR